MTTETCLFVGCLAYTEWPSLKRPCRRISISPSSLPRTNSWRFWQSCVHTRLNFFLFITTTLSDWVCAVYVGPHENGLILVPLECDYSPVPFQVIKDSWQWTSRISCFYFLLHFPWLWINIVSSADACGLSSLLVELMWMYCMYSLFSRL